jgi:hypothetical protein
MHKNNNNYNNEHENNNHNDNCDDTNSYYVFFRSAEYRRQRLMKWKSKKLICQIETEEEKMITSTLKIRFLVFLACNLLAKMNVF